MQDFADWLTEPPAGGPIQMWIVGAGIGSVVFGYGLLCCITQRAVTLNVTMRGFEPLQRGLWLHLDGVQAVTLGLLITCLGLFIHFQWFWGNHPRLSRYYEPAKYMAVVGVVAALLAHSFVVIART